MAKATAKDDLHSILFFPSRFLLLFLLYAHTRARSHSPRLSLSLSFWSRLNLSDVYGRRSFYFIRASYTFYVRTLYSVCRFSSSCCRTLRCHTTTRVCWELRAGSLVPFCRCRTCFSSHRRRRLINILFPYRFIFSCLARCRHVNGSKESKAGECETEREKKEAGNCAHLHDFINGCEMWILIMIWARAQCVGMDVNEKWTEWECFEKKEASCGWRRWWWWMFRFNRMRRVNGAVARKNRTQTLFIHSTHFEWKKFVQFSWIAVFLN